jgi:CAAX protease family protein
MVHYRGLARRARTHEPYPARGWRLSHAWVACFLFGSAQVLALYGAGPIDLMGLDESSTGIDATPEQLAQVSVVTGMLAIAFLLPLGAMANRYSVQWWGRQWSIGRALLLGCGIGIVFRLPLLLAWLGSDNSIDPGSTQQELWLVLEAMRDQLNLASALWFLGIFAPVIEEFIFRGVLLNALAAHIRFGWANVLQALLFAAGHADPKAFVPLFLLGLVSGTCARRSGGLLASMVLHAVFNLIGGWIVLAHD